MKKSILFNAFILGLVFFTFASCEKESNQEVWSTVTLKQEVDMYASNYFQIFEYAYNKYPMSVFCACDCSSGDAVQESINTNLSLLGGGSPMNLSCSDYMDGIGFTCGQDFTDIRNRLSVEIDSLSNIRIINPQEATIIKSMADEIVNSPLTVDFQKYMIQLNGITLDDSRTSGVITYSLIVNCIKAHEYFSVFPTPTTDRPTFLIHKGLGALGGAWWNAMLWTWDNRHCLDCNGGAGLGRELARGAVGGALMSL